MKKQLITTSTVSLISVNAGQAGKEGLNPPLSLRMMTYGPLSNIKHPRFVDHAMLRKAAGTANSTQTIILPLVLPVSNETMVYVLISALLIRSPVGRGRVPVALQLDSHIEKLQVCNTSRQICCIVQGSYV